LAALPLLLFDVQSNWSGAWPKLLRFLCTV